MYSGVDSACESSCTYARDATVIFLMTTELESEDMKTIARYLIYVLFMLSAVMLMVQPFARWWETGEVDSVQLLVHCFFAFSLVFAGTEASEGLRKRWDK